MTDTLADLDPEAAQHIRNLHKLGYSPRQIATLLVIAGYPAPTPTH
jgi:hypothetical protein